MADGNEKSDTVRVIVPPNTWTHVREIEIPERSGSDFFEDTPGIYMVEVFHQSMGGVEFEVSAFGGVTFTQGAPVEGYRVRRMPVEDSLIVAQERADQVAREEREAAELGALAGHDLNTEESRQAAAAESERLTEQAIAEGLELGYYEITGKTFDGQNKYRLTEKGMRRAEELIGLPRGAIE